jgi:hypothetical protein
LIGVAVPPLYRKEFIFGLIPPDFYLCHKRPVQNKNKIINITTLMPLMG